jgi:hypothetical protein
MRSRADLNNLSQRHYPLQIEIHYCLYSGRIEDYCIDSRVCAFPCLLRGSTRDRRISTHRYRLYRLHGFTAFVSLLNHSFHLKLRPLAESSFFCCVRPGLRAYPCFGTLFKGSLSSLLSRHSPRPWTLYCKFALPTHWQVMKVKPLAVYIKTMGSFIPK